ncbi:MAG: hypothetical protein FWG69_04635 [Oscillospiraceae bacterium]|nr:hypothetical protein [Oscillospiraceae bacterium]
MRGQIGQIVKQIRNRASSRKGSSLSLVLVILTVVLLLGAAMLMTAQYSLYRTAGVATADKHYYSAESAAQLAAQIFTGEMNKSDSNFYIDRYNVQPAELSSVVAGMKDELSNKLLDENFLQGVFNNISGKINEMDFNGQKAQLVSITGHPDNAIKSVEEENTPDVGVTVYSVIVYLDDPVFIIKAKSGGRTVAVNVGYETGYTENTDIEEQPGIEYNDVGDGGAFYTDRNTGPYLGSTNEVYSMFTDAMSDMHSRVRSMNRNSVIDPGITNWETVLNTSARNVEIGTGSNMTTMGAGTYNNLEYLVVNGDLTINGNVNCPNLIAIYVTGRMVVNGATLNGRSGADSGTNVLIMCGSRTAAGGNFNSLDIRGTATINWFRFFVRGGNIEFTDTGGNNVFNSNSVFIATMDSSGNYGQLRAGMAGQRNFRFAATGDILPQFYSEGRMTLYVHNSGVSYIGIFGTMSSETIFNGGGTASLQGMIVGNIGNTSVSNNANPPVGNVPPSKFSSGSENRIMSGGVYGILNEGGGTGWMVPPWEKVEVTFRGSAKDNTLDVYETTGIDD